MKKKISSSICDLKKNPSKKSSLETQLIYGEEIKIIKSQGNWSLCEILNDGYIGWLETKNLGNCSSFTHIICQPICHLYEKKDIKSNVMKYLYFNSKINVLEESEIWYSCLLNNRRLYAHKKNFTMKNSICSDWVNVALLFLKTPYLWGGKSILGIDCSGLVQLALNHIGVHIPRNANDQYNYLKTKLSTNLKRGSLVFWDGHVAIGINEEKILHSNGHHLSVEIENFSVAQKRIESVYGEVKDIKSLDF